MDLQCDFLPFDVNGNKQFEFLHWNYFPLFESRSNHVINKNLGLVEISGIRVIGIINDGNVNQGSIVKLSKCGLDINNSPYYEFSPT